MDKKLAIKACARELFNENGYKKTSISSIMEKCQMATGTFYLYYESKDHIFMEIYMEENEKLKKEIMSKIDTKMHPMLVMEKLMTMNNEGMQKNPILKEWYNKDSFAKIEKSFRKNKGLENLDFMYSDFLEIVKSWQSEDIMRSDISPEMIMAIFNSLVNIETHKDEIGIKHFPEIMNYLGTFVMEGLMKNE